MLVDPRPIFPIIIINNEYVVPILITVALEIKENNRKMWKM